MGPDGINNYWNHIGTDKKLLSCSQQGGGSIIVWLCFSYHSLNNLVALIGNQDKIKNFRLIHDELLLFSTN